MMYEDEEEEMEQEQQEEEPEIDPDEITSEQWQEACWVVISAYFDEKVNFLKFQWKITKKNHGKFSFS